MADLHPVQQPISEIDTFIDADHEAAGFKVGSNNVTRIEACTKPGLHCDIPYVRVWAGDHCIAEFCQHNIVGVYFAPVPVERAPKPEPETPAGGWPADHTGDGSCTCTECIPF